MTFSARLTVVGMLGALGAVGCHDGLRPDLTISASLSPHIAIYQGPFVSIALQNESPRTIQMAACGGTDVLPLRERLVNGRWISDPMANCVEPFQVRELAPEEAISLASWNFSGVTGTYRFRAPLFQDAMSVRASRDVSAAITIP
jgi:hypothetical protein